MHFSLYFWWHFCVQRELCHLWPDGQVSNLVVSIMYSSSWWWWWWWLCHNGGGGDVLRLKSNSTQEQWQLQRCTSVCERCRQAQVIFFSYVSYRISQCISYCLSYCNYHPVSDSFPLNLFKSYAEKPCVMWLWFDEIVKHVMWQDLMRLWKIHFEFPGLARNQPWSHPWSNPIRQLDLTNWQTEHSATSSTSLKALFNFSAEFLQPCKLSKSFDRTWTNVNLQFQPLIHLQLLWF